MAKKEQAKKNKVKKDKKGKKSAEAPVEENAGGGKKKLIIIILLALLVLGGAGGGAAFFFLGGAATGEMAEEAASEAPEVEEVEATKRVRKEDPRYVDLDPDFTINLEDDGATRFVQIAISILTYFSDTEEAVEENKPIIRNNIILMIGRKSIEELSTSEGKENLRKEVLDEVERIIQENSVDGTMRIDKVFFTKFVMQ